MGDVIRPIPEMTEEEEKYIRDSVLDYHESDWQDPDLRLGWINDLESFRRQKAKSSLPSQLYRHFDKNGKLLYVGISMNAINRLSGHKSGSSWFFDIATITVEHFKTREEAADAEILAIVNEGPEHNITFKVPKGYKMIRIEE